MRIVNITATHLKLSGGIPYVLENLVRYQNQVNEVESVILSINATNSEISDDNIIYKTTYEDIYSFLNDFDPDLVVFHSFYYLQYIRIARFLKNNNFKYLITPHSSFMMEAQKKNFFKKKIANFLLFRTFARNATGFVYLNDSEKNNSIFSSKCEMVVPNGVEIPDINYAKSNDVFKLFFLGRIDINHKGLDILFEELNDNRLFGKNIQLDIIGNGDEYSVNKVREWIKQCKYVKVNFLGPKYNTEKNNLLLRYNAMILTSRYEGFPITILEAMSYGIPCILSKGTNMMEEVQKNNLGWGTDNGIVNALLEAISACELNQHAYFDKNRNYVLSKYSWKNIAEDSIKQFRGV